MSSPTSPTSARIRKGAWCRTVRTHTTNTSQAGGSKKKGARGRRSSGSGYIVTPSLSSYPSRRNRSWGGRRSTASMDGCVCGFGGGEDEGGRSRATIDVGDGVYGKYATGKSMVHLEYACGGTDLLLRPVSLSVVSSRPASPPRDPPRGCRLTKNGPSLGDNIK
jgi:hypothetical protein